MTDQMQGTGVEEILTPFVRQVMSIQEIEADNEDQAVAVLYRGRLIMDSQEVFQRLDPLFADQDLTLLLREDGEQQLILGVPGTITPQPSNPWVNVLLFGLTIVSMLYVGSYYGLEGPIDGSMTGIFRALLGNINNGIIFTASLLGILTAHEFGHYFAARYHKTAVSLPYFIPFPSLFGTMGAFIRLKQPPRNRRELLDIGLAGPIAGLILCIPLLIIGLSLSEVGELASDPEVLGGLEGNSILYLALKYLIKGELLPMPQTFGGIPPALYWIRYLFLGMPIPLGGRDVLLHPMAWAGWAGLLVTSLNLIPAGQLDGGHTIYVLIGRAAARLWPFIVIALVLLGIVWQGWFIWAVLMFLMGRTYATPRDDITPLDSRRRAVAIFGLIIFVLIFTPVPLTIY